MIISSARSSLLAISLVARQEGIMTDNALSLRFPAAGSTTKAKPNLSSIFLAFLLSMSRPINRFTQSKSNFIGPWFRANFFSSAIRLITFAGAGKKIAVKSMHGLAIFEHHVICYIDDVVYRTRADRR